jgi:putative hydrolase of the HAD superfamily
MITTVIFDLDDTLYDEIDYCRSGFAAVAEFLATIPALTQQHTMSEISDAFRAQLSAGNRTSSFNAALDELGIPYETETIEHLVEVYREHSPSITLPADSRQVLDLLKEKYRLALLTDGFLPGQKLKVEALGIADDFHTIVYTEELGRGSWKPSPAGFRKILKTLHEKASNCAYVADNAEKDFIAPHELGMATIQIVRPNRVRKDPTHDAALCAQQIIAAIEQLPHALEFADRLPESK